MQAGRELDALVARKVMGIADAQVFGRLGAMYDFTADQGLPKFHVPCYSTDIAAAWTVVDKLSPDHGVTLKKTGDVWECGPLSRNDEPLFLVQAPSAPLAICLAALKAVGVQTTSASR